MFCLPTPVAMATNFGIQLTITRPTWKIIARCLHIFFYFRARAFRRCHLNFFLADHCYHGNKFWKKIDYNSAPLKGNCALFAPTPLFLGPGYPMVSFKFVRWRFLLSWQLTVFIQRLNWLVLYGPLWNSTRDNIAPEPFLLFSSFDLYCPYIVLETVKIFLLWFLLFLVHFCSEFCYLILWQ